MQGDVLQKRMDQRAVNQRIVLLLRKGRRIKDGSFFLPVTQSSNGGLVGQACSLRKGILPGIPLRKFFHQLRIFLGQKRRLCVGGRRKFFLAMDAQRHPAAQSQQQPA